MHGLEVVNTVMFVSSALVLVGIFSSLIATAGEASVFLGETRFNHQEEEPP